MNDDGKWLTPMEQIPELMHDIYVRQNLHWRRQVEITPQLLQDVYENRYFPWKTPPGWYYRPMNMRRFSRRYDWFKPGDITQRARKAKFQMKFVILF